MKRTISDVDLKGKRILMRADFNVPLANVGGYVTVADDYRIREALATIRAIRTAGGRLAICAHLGRPKGERTPELSLEPVARQLSELVEIPVGFVDECVGEKVRSAVNALGDGDVVLLENTRFHPEEKQNDADFAARLAEPFDLFVNDAFGAAHRAHASTVGVTDSLPSAQGLLMQREVEAITGVTESPEKPFVVILGGAKVSDKIGVVRALASRADAILTGGGMANTILAARGAELGTSLVETDAMEEVHAIDREFGSRVYVPVDLVVADEIAEGAQTETVHAERVPPGKAAGDIGPETLERYREILGDARTVVWNGPMGVFELERFAEGTNRTAEILAGLDATVVCGGGDSAAAVRSGGYADRLTHVSTGGGAFLELIEHGSLPGIDAIDDA